MRICVDTNILIDILKAEHHLHEEKLFKAIEAKHDLIIPSIVYAELMPQFKGDSILLEDFLADFKIKIEDLNLKATRLASERWLKYLNKKTKVKCPHCNLEINIKAHVLSDFFIGGFALAQSDLLLTRDRGIYKQYFSDLELF